MTILLFLEFIFCLLVGFVIVGVSKLCEIVELLKWFKKEKIFKAVCGNLTNGMDSFIEKTRKRLNEAVGIIEDEKNKESGTSA